MTYHIDKCGYLLDQNNYYLLDRTGYQIKLDEKHYKLL
jgi:flagellar basal body rod protein FlgG